MAVFQTKPEKGAIIGYVGLKGILLKGVISQIWRLVAELAGVRISGQRVESRRQYLESGTSGQTSGFIGDVRSGHETCIPDRASYVAAKTSQHPMATSDDDGRNSVDHDRRSKVWAGGTHLSNKALDTSMTRHPGYVMMVDRLWTRTPWSDYDMFHGLCHNQVFGAPSCGFSLNFRYHF